MISKKCFKDFDFIIFSSTFLLLVFGLLAVHSTTYPNNHILFWKQVIWIIIGVCVAIGFYLSSYKIWNGFSWVFYLLSIGGTLLVLVIGINVQGVKRWIGVGGIRFQPSEFAKLGTMFLMAAFLSNKKFQIRGLRNLIIPLIIIGIPFVLVLLEPDIGTSLIFIFLGILMLFYKGTNLLYIFVIGSPLIAFICGVHWIPLLIFLISLGLIIYFLKFPLTEGIPVFLLNLVIGLLHPILWNCLKPYQRARIIGFLSPSRDLRGMGWQLLQSKIAVGSGGLTGKGILGGTQKGFAFLPQAHTDFIFSAMGEELGFLGCCVIFACFAIFLWRAIVIAKTARADFVGFLAVGIAGILGFQMFMNISMTLGIIPVVGVPLPFISYGGSSMVISLAMVGLLLNLAKHRYEY
ncbi:rod shape-determining protein RodA [candidate division WOR-3 bacterium]|nr:rod shape-determining protein RodA [candidate division WOR-3 bacterium]